MTYGLRHGWAFRFTLLPDGRRQILSVLLPGDIVCHHGTIDQPLPYAVQSLTPVTLCTLNTELLTSLAGEPGRLQMQIAHYLAAEALTLQSRLVDIGRRSALERMAGLLLDLYRRLSARGGLDGPGAVPFFLRQEHMADMLGLTPVHVSRTLTELRRHGAIALERQRLEVRGPALLAHLSGFAESARPNRPMGAAPRSGAEAHS